jgi:hypothetical protein
VTSYPEANVLAVRLDCTELNGCYHTDPVAHKSMEERKNEPTEENRHAEAGIIHAQLVQERVLHKSRLLELEVEAGKVHNW